MSGIDYPWYLLVLIPIISSTIGYVTNVLAVKMLFKPTKFVGIGPIGWQGIVPSHAVKLGRAMYRLINTNLLKFGELFGDGAAEELLSAQEDKIQELTRRVVAEQAVQIAKPMWDMLPDDNKEQVYEVAAGEVREASKAIINNMIDNIDTIMDVEPVVVNAAKANAGLMGKIFLEVGQNEFKFIERSGLYFGFLFGLVQLAVWIVFPQWWILPLFGFLVGYATNWLAIKLIFSPREPVRVLGFTIQGLFHKRQEQVSADFAKMVSGEILTDEALFAQMTSSGSKAKIIEMIKSATDGLVDRYKSHPMASTILTEELADTVQTSVMAEIEAEVFSEHGPLAMVAHKSQEIRETLNERMSQLPPEPFEGVLRPAFQEDEWKLIITGAVLGLCAGTMQLVYIFGEALAK